MPALIGKQIRSYYRHNDNGGTVEVIKTTRGQDRILYITCRASDGVTFDIPYTELNRDYTRVDKP